MNIATIGAGCFWCVEAIFRSVPGINDVVCGYSGGETSNPSYEEVVSGITGHAEVVQIIYNSEIISFEEILEIFWQTHDPTTLNKQGADIGSQYRSIILYHTKTQEEEALRIKKKLDETKIFKSKIVTEIVEFKEFYKAEEYHQDFYKIKLERYLRYKKACGREETLKRIWSQ